MEINAIMEDSWLKIKKNTKCCECHQNSIKIGGPLIKGTCL